MPNPGDIKYCDALGGRATNAAFVWIPPGSFWMGDKRDRFNPAHFVVISKGFWLQQTPLTAGQYQQTGSPNSIPKGNLTWNNVVDFC